MDRGRGVGRRARADGKNQVGLPLVGEGDHLGNVLVGEAHDALRLGDAVQVEPVGINGLQQRLHDLGPLDAGHLEAVLPAVLEAFGRVRQTVGVAAGLADALEEFAGFLHAVHGWPFIRFKGSRGQCSSSPEHHTRHSLPMRTKREKGRVCGAACGWEGNGRDVARGDAEARKAWGKVLHERTKRKQKGRLESGRDANIENHENRFADIERPTGGRRMG